MISLYLTCLVKCSSFPLSWILCHVRVASIITINSGKLYHKSNHPPHWLKYLRCLFPFWYVLANYTELCKSLESLLILTFCFKEPEFLFYFLKWSWATVLQPFWSSSTVFLWYTGCFFPSFCQSSGWHFGIRSLSQNTKLVLICEICARCQRK